MERIAQMIKKGAATLSDAEIAALADTLQQQPYFQAAHMLYAQALHLRQDMSYGAALRQAAITLPDRKALFKLTEGSKTPLPERERQHGGDRTDNLITGFLNTLPQEKTRKPAKADPATDYMAYLLQTEADNGDQYPEVTMPGQELIDEFIDKKHGHRIALTDRKDEEILTPEKQENGEYITETMARIYIKQGKYDKAVKIIERLSAQVPRKNTYFADQLRFLGLLIENNKYNNT